MSRKITDMRLIKRHKVICDACGAYITRECRSDLSPPPCETRNTFADAPDEIEAAIRALKEPRP